MSTDPDLRQRAEAHLQDKGTAGHPEDIAKAQSKTVRLAFASADMAEFMLARIVRAFRQEEFYVYRLSPDTSTYHVRKDEMFFILEGEGGEIRLSTTIQHETLARLIIAEEMLTLRSMLHMAQEDVGLDSMEHNLVSGLFGGNGEFKP